METTINQSVVDEDGDVVVEKKCKDGVGSANKHPVHKESETNEDGRQDGGQTVPKFGITLNKTTNNEETTQVKMMTRNSPALQEALVGFLSIAGKGISAWMMLSMSNSTSDEIKKE